MSNAGGEKRTRQARYSRDQSESVREIGPLPPVADPDRKGRAGDSFRVFCETYFPQRFPLAWGEPHLRAIARMEACVRHGGLYALALARGSGKTTLAECAALWAVLYGRRSFVVLIAATADRHAGPLLDSIKSEIENNEMLLEDFPEACHPVRRLQGIHNRAPGQTLDGRRTCIEWTTGRVIFPTVADAACSGAILATVGITGAVRGMKVADASGVQRRPDLAILDDPQTDESAASPIQNHARERVIKQAVLNLAGPGKKIAAVMPCTVIVPGDLADRFLDRDRNPEWQGERTKFLLSPPTDRALWDAYAGMRAESLRAGGDGTEATEFYWLHRAEMDEGAATSWPERFNHDELSAVQHAVNLRLRDERAFNAEYQNDPDPPDVGGDLVELTPDEVCAKTSGTPRGAIPHGVTRVTCGVDVQGNCLFWLVAGWGEDFGGGVIDYGVYPRQNRAYFAQRDARPALADVYPSLPETARLYAGLSALVPDLLARLPQIERVVIDAGWGVSTDAVYEFCRKSSHASLLLPSHGRGITASMIPLRELPVHPGERRIYEGKVTGATVGRGRHATFDANAWKSFVTERLRTPAAAKGCLWLPGSRPAEHQLLADHLCAEYRVKTKGRGRDVEEWKIRPNKPDNHWLDCLVLAAVGASVQGLFWSPAQAAGEAAAAPSSPRKKWSEMQKAKRGGAGRA